MHVSLWWFNGLYSILHCTVYMSSVSCVCSTNYGKFKNTWRPIFHHISLLLSCCRLIGLPMWLDQTKKKRFHLSHCYHAVLYVTITEFVWHAIIGKYVCIDSYIAKNSIQRISTTSWALFVCYNWNSQSSAMVWNYESSATLKLWLVCFRVTFHVC